MTPRRLHAPRRSYVWRKRMALKRNLDAMLEQQRVLVQAATQGAALAAELAAAALSAVNLSADPKGGSHA